MIRAEIRDPQSKLSFMEFTHGTTCIVGVPHGADSELWVKADHPCTLVIEAAGRELHVGLVEPPGGAIKLSTLRQPLVRTGLSGLLGAWRAEKPNTPVQRLYNFRALIHEGTPEKRGNLLATFDFHLLCEVDFHWARAYHLELNQASEAVTERAEGTCPHCLEVRTRLEKQWRYET